MAAPAALANQVADALVAQLAVIDSTDGSNQWRTKPATIARTLKADALVIAQRPILAVEVASGEVTELGASRHREIIELVVTAITDSQLKKPEQAAMDLVADVLFAITKNEYMTNLLAEPIRAGRWEIDTEAVTASGLGVATLRLACVVDYDHSVQP